MITLFHGSVLAISQPLVSFGRKNLDFGPGFYLTMLRPQAEAWSQVIAERKGPNAIPTLSEYEFDEQSAWSSGFRCKRFAQYDNEWLDYVVDCRHGGNLHLQYDLVEGGVANDNVIDTIEDYENGIITAEQALGQLRYKKVNHQICILNQDIIDQFLHFKQSIELEKED